MVFFGLNIFESVVTRGSGTSTTAVWTSNRPAEAVVGVLPRVSALKMVVLPDWGNPIIPSFIHSFLTWGGLVIRLFVGGIPFITVGRIGNPPISRRATIPPHD